MVDPAESLYGLVNSFEDIHLDDASMCESATYLSNCNVEVYISEGVTLLMCARQNDNIDPVAFLQEYFEKVSKGEHVLGSRFVFVLETKWNRLSFGKCLIRSLGHIKSDRLVHAGDFVQLIRLHCEDFSSDLIRVCWSLFAAESKSLVFKVALECVVVWLLYVDCFDEMVRLLCPGNDSSIESSNLWDHNISAKHVESTISGLKSECRPPRFALDRTLEIVLNSDEDLFSVRYFFQTLLGDQVGLYRFVFQASKAKKPF
mmetsp:Transcript_17095/g.27651  ORF Transcript_17095/g.27651 Transcript_17095/m.27651 type:complete len:259 (+) Transcript_17095:342-1118(+)